MSYKKVGPGDVTGLSLVFKVGEHRTQDSRERGKIFL